MDSCTTNLGTRKYKIWLFPRIQTLVMGKRIPAWKKTALWEWGSSFQIGFLYTNQKMVLNKSMVKYRYLMLYLQQKCCCPLFILQTSTRRPKEKKGKDKRKGLSGWCLIGHNDNLWYSIKMPPLLLRKSARATLQLWWWDLSSRIFLPTPMQLVCSTAQAWCLHWPGDIQNKGKDGITKVYCSCSHHHHRFAASNPPISSDFSGTKCPTAEKTYKL